MDKSIVWLRISYWAGAIIDGLAAIRMLVPQIAGTMSYKPGFHTGNDYKYAMGMGASLMLGWTALLLWADQKPVERKGILLITVFPAIFGLVVSEIWAVSVGFLTMGATIPIWMLQTALIWLFIFSYRNAKSTPLGEQDMHILHTHEPADRHVSESEDNIIHWASRYDLLLKLLFLGQEQTIRRRLLEPASIQPGDIVLDVGCGTGTMALAANALAGPTGKVSGIDPSPEMIDVARRKAGKAGADVDFRVGLIQEIPFQDDQFDAVLSSFMFHHLADDEAKRQGLAEIRRVLKPGGCCLIIDFKSPNGPLLHRWARHLHGDSVTENESQALVSMLEAAGFENVEQGKPRSWIAAAASFVRGKAPHV